jgi:hypothetical protein
MVRAAWRHRFGPPSTLLGLALLTTAAITTSAAVAASLPAPFVSACPATSLDASRAATARSDRKARLRVGDQTSGRGQLLGRVLRLQPSRGTAKTISLPRESFVADRIGDLIVYTRFDAARGSEVHLLNASTACDTMVARPAGAVRSAILSRDASTLYVHTVARGSRRDEGVTRFDLRTGAGSAFVPALAQPRWLDRVFGTELAWSVDGQSLIVQSCGFARCLTRLANLATGGSTTVDAPGQGALIGATDTKLVTYSTCLGRPCAVIAWDIATGASQVLEPEAFDAVLSGTLNGSAVVTLQTAEGTREVSL